MFKNMSKEKSLILVLFLAFLLLVPFKNVSAITPSVLVGDEELYDNLSENKNSDETAIYDFENNTLTLNNYNGGPIEYFDNEDLTIVLKGNNVITSDGTTTGIFIGMENIIDNLKITGDGNLKINDAMFGIEFYGNNLVFDNTNIEINRSFFGIVAFDISFKNSKIVVNSDMAGILAQGSIDIDGGYIEATGGTEGAGAAIVAVLLDDSDEFTMSDDMCIFPNDVTMQTTTVDFLGTYDAITFGKDNATIEFSGLSAETSNVASNVTIKSKYKVTFNTNGGNEIDDIEIFSGDIIEQPQSPVKDGYEFVAWYEDVDLTKNYDFNTKATKDLTLYAKWEKLPKEYTYEMLSEENISFTIKKVDSLSIKIDGDHLLFDSLKIGALDLIKEVDYTVTKGSTVLTFTESGIAKLNLLAAGKYDIEANYTNGKKVKGTLTIEETKEEQNPKTGDNIITSIIVASVALVGLVGCRIYINRKESNT